MTPNPGAAPGQRRASRLVIPAKAGVQKGEAGALRHSSGSWNPGRRSRPASSFRRKPESRQGKAGALNGFRPWNAAFSGHSRRLRQAGMLLYKPLDSGFRRNDDGAGFRLSPARGRQVWNRRPTPAGMRAYRDVGGRAASGTSRRGGRAASGTGGRRLQGCRW